MGSNSVVNCNGVNPRWDRILNPDGLEMGLSYCFTWSGCRRLPLGRRTHCSNSSLHPFSKLQANKTPQKPFHAIVSNISRGTQLTVPSFNLPKNLSANNFSFSNFFAQLRLTNFSFSHARDYFSAEKRSSTQNSRDNFRNIKPMLYVIILFR
jgi:hypothetical protein